MNDTPETDDQSIIYAINDNGYQVPCVDLEFARRLERERDEAREEIKELIYIAERAIDLAEIDFENDKFGVVSELRDGLERIKEGAK
jgi:hypothetical protein